MEQLNHFLFLMVNAAPETSLSLIHFAQLVAEWPLLIAVLLVGVAILQQRNEFLKKALHLGTALVLALAITAFIRMLWYHPRPFAIELGTLWMQHAPTSSLPSMHATFLFALGLATWSAGLNKVIALLIVLLALSTSWARVFLGVHYPFDILAAFVVSAFATIIVAYVTPRFFSK